MSRARLYCGDALAILQTLPAESVQCVVTSPPYFGLRDYGVPGQLGLEASPDDYVGRMVEIFAAVRDVLRDDGTLWLNVGDSYAAGGKGGGGSFMAERRDAAWQKRSSLNGWRAAPDGMKAKDLVGIPWMLAFALRAAGWFLRSDIIWSKPNPMPESVTDRPTKAHEYVFLLSKNATYYYDAAAIAEEVTDSTIERLSQPTLGIQAGSMRANGGAKTNGPMKAVVSAHMKGTPRNDGDRWRMVDGGVAARGRRNARTVWTLPTMPYTGAHFATFPEELARRCIVAGSRPGDTVLDPFGGSGTVAQVATGNGRDSIYIDLNPAYIELAKLRIGPMLCDEGPPLRVGERPAP
jgi:DNA modification methylase